MKSNTNKQLDFNGNFFNGASERTSGEPFGSGLQNFHHFNDSHNELKNRLKLELVNNGYLQNNIIIEDNIENNSIFLTLLQTNLIENPGLIKFIKCLENNSNDALYEIVNNNVAVKKEITLSSLKNVLDSYSTSPIDWASILHEVSATLMYLESNIFFNMSDEPPVILFTLKDYVLTIDFATQDKHKLTPFGYSLLDRHCIYQILSEEDLIMANYLITLNNMPDSVRNILWVTDTIDFDGIIKLANYNCINPNDKERHESWLRNPTTLKWLRKERISKILEHL